MAQLLNIVDDKVIINKLAVKYLEGTILHAGSFEIAGSVHVQNNLSVVGTITADTFNVKNLVTENGSLDSVGDWIYSTEPELNGKGFSWTASDVNLHLQYRTGKRLRLTGGDIDIDDGRGYQIDNTPVLTANELGKTVVHSNLRTIGTLEDLKVSGDVNLGDFIFVNSTFNRLGIGTEEPNSAISIIDNNVEITIGSPQYNLAAIGTHSNHDLGIVTDNIPRITVRSSGEVQIGDAGNNSAVMRVYGTIYADNIVSNISIPQITVFDDKISINKVVLKYTEGSVIHAGSLDILGSTTVQSDLKVTGQLEAPSIFADTIRVKNLITETGAPSDLGKWITHTEAELEGKGFNWTWGEGGTHLSYRARDTLTTNAHIDTENTYMIKGYVVLSSDGLGQQVVNSKLTSVGNLTALTVDGSATFNSTVDIGNLSIDSQTTGTTIASDKAVSLAVGKFKGVTVNEDNTVQIGSSGLPANVQIFGTLRVDTVISDTKLTRSSSLIFKSDEENTMYGKGLTWSGDSVHQLMLIAGPDRLWSTASFDLGPNQQFMIDGREVINSKGLGESIQHSSLTTLGNLDSLTVNGVASFNNITTKEITSNTDGHVLKINGRGIEGAGHVSVATDNQSVLEADGRQIVIGNIQNTARPVKVFGPLSVGINNPDPTVNFAVGGDVNLGGKRFTNGTSAPTYGVFAAGDMCWNTAPTRGGFVGWICIVGGTPGEWAPFGAIVAQ
jgi:hypothetical protein